MVPLLASLVLASRGDYRAAFAFLAIPAGLAIAALLAARGLRQTYWLYLLGAALVAAGSADFPLIAFHFERAAVVLPNAIPGLYAVAMGMDALSALVFDRLGLGVLASATALGALFAPLVFLDNSALAGMVCWGMSMGAQESILHAAVAEMSDPERRGTAYGIFNVGYGSAWFAGSALMGACYDVSLPAVLAFSLSLQALAALVFLRLGVLARSRAGVDN